MERGNVTEREEKEFVPLRESLKRKAVEKEDNLMTPYYHEQNSITQLSDEQVDEIRWQNGTEIEGENCPKPITSFQDLNLPPELQRYLANNGYARPTAIQMQALSCVMSGRDIIGLAETGSGKTLAYSLPLCMFLKTRKPCLPAEGPVALIVTPTRELMRQVSDHVAELLNFLTMSTTCGSSGNVGLLQNYNTAPVTRNFENNTHWGMNSSCTSLNTSVHDYDPFAADMSLTYSPLRVTPVSFKYQSAGICGGVPISHQVQELKSGVDVVIATPGRLLDLCKRGILSLEKVSYLVMDEADKMLGMGMEEQLRKVVGLATGTIRARQTLLWTATMPESLERLARSAVLNPIKIQVGPGTGLISPTIQQNVVFLYHYEKPAKLLQVLRSTPFPPVMVFASSIQNVDYVTELLKKEQFHASGLHSEKSQDYRFKLIDAFRDGKVDVLVATDVGSRGLDFPEVAHVINYDLPDSIEDYVHRCGRTGRMGHFGVATSFLTLDCKIADELKEMLEIMDQVVPKELQNTKQFGKKIIKTEFGDRVVDS